MSLNETPAANRLHIGFFGRRNAGKSSLVNAVANQEVSIVSPIQGTTTDPVSKSMELLPLGPVVLLDTPGLDDIGELGALRVRRTRQILNRIDLSVLVVDATAGYSDCDHELITLMTQKSIPFLVALNKCDQLPSPPTVKPNEIAVSATTRQGVETLKEKLAHLMPTDEGRRLLDGLVRPLDTIVLVIPIDESAPKGRIILPQQQALRDVLDAGGIAVVARHTELQEALARLKKPPRLVITDSQVFGEVAKIVPQEVPLTSFSILMARYKGFLDTAIRGARAIPNLADGARVLIAEGCTHHRQCNDIGTVKLPRLLRNFTGKDFQFETSSGQGFPEDLSPYSLILHCGGCMLTEREVRYRMKCAEDQGIPFTNYGISIAFMKGILARTIAPLET